MTLIEIRPHRNAWEVFEAPGVEPVFPDKDDAIDYAQQRACFRSGEIRVLGDLLPLALPWLISFSLGRTEQVGRFIVTIT
jgi:hypothetical protein